MRFKAQTPLEERTPIDHDSPFAKDWLWEVADRICADYLVDYYADTLKSDTELLEGHIRDSKVLVPHPDGFHFHELKDKLLSLLQEVTESAVVKHLAIRTYEELTNEEKQEALTHEIGEILTMCAELDSEDVPSTLRQAVVEAWEEIERFKTPWFFGETLYERAEVNIRELAQRSVEQAIYPATHQPVIFIRPKKED